ncbi:hypothetical protein [Pseudoalteromonas sp.]|jgi:hypothetical protein|uniref:hypothetical protein n=1 Tax=Pseudoalteromonas sp. TaxID=53249 RepID=UPI0023579495|nr:hypothetical protein [Pseudoalteromonas sp.]
MSLIIKDFDKQTIVSKSHVVLSVNRIPRAHLEGLNYIVYDKARFFQRNYSDASSVNQNVLGTYNSLPKNYVCIFKFSSLREFEHILYHEIGHHVFQHILSAQQRRYWVSELHRFYPEFISKYACTNGQEDFCECYAHYFTLPSKLQRLGKKYKFINDLV